MNKLIVRRVMELRENVGLIIVRAGETLLEINRTHEDLT